MNSVTHPETSGDIARNRQFRGINMGRASEELARQADFGLVHGDWSAVYSDPGPSVRYSNPVEIDWLAINAEFS